MIDPNTPVSRPSSTGQAAGQAVSPAQPDDVADLASRLAQAEETIRAIHYGEVDAVVVNGPDGPQVYTLEGADHPYRVLVEQMHQGTVTLNEEGLILYSNPQFATLMGTLSDAVTGTSFQRFLHGGSANSFASLMETATARGYSAGELNLRDEGDYILPVRASLALLEVPGMRTISIMISDLREMQRNEAIVKEEQLSRLILEQAGESIVVIDPHGVVVRRSESAKLLAGSNVLLDQFDRVFSLSVDGEALTSARILEAAASDEPIRGVDATMLHPNGKKSSLLLSASPLWSETNQLLGCVVMLTDITGHKLAEAALERQAEELARSNSDLRQFAYSASHDLREPLRQLAVFSELIQERFNDKLGEEGNTLIGHAVNAAHGMEKLVADLLAYIQAADAPQNTTSAADPNLVLQKILTTFASQIEESGARIEFDALPPLNMHEVHLTQLLQNLIGNALKYRSDLKPLIRIRAERAQKMWRVSVEDNGIGIEPDYQSQVFGLFQRLHGGGKYSGSGIGLAICQKIVKRYGGKIWVESQAGNGSKFLFTLPGAQG